MARVTAGSIRRTHARWPYLSSHVVTASASLCSWTPRWRSPVQASGSERPSSACHSSGGMSSSATHIPTWFTGLLVIVWIARSASERPRNSQMSPVAAVAMASSKGSVDSVTAGNLRDAMRARWKLLGLAGAAGVAATGVVVARNRRPQSDYTPDELRERLRSRLEQVEAGNEQAAPVVPKE